MHAPNGSNQQPYRFLFIDDADRKAALADIYRAAMDEFVDRPAPTRPRTTSTAPPSSSSASPASVFYLRDHLDEVPVLCVPLVAGRTDGFGDGAQADRTRCSGRRAGGAR